VHELLHDGHLFVEGAGLVVFDEGVGVEVEEGEFLGEGEGVGVVEVGGGGGGHVFFGFCLDPHDGVGEGGAAVPEGNEIFQ